MFTYVTRKHEAESLQDSQRALGHEIQAVHADVRDYRRAQEVVQQLMESFGRFDGLVNNAGITRDKALMLMEESDWRDVLDVNLTGTFHACRAAIVTFMKQRSGRIVNITSVAGVAGAPRQVNYAASRAGVIGLTRALAAEVAPHGITVNAVAPGYIATEMTAGINEKRATEIRARIPLGRFGQPSEVAQLVTYLLSDAAAYLTGQTLVLDGGLTL